MRNKERFDFSTFKVILTSFWKMEVNKQKTAIKCRIEEQLEAMQAPY